MSTTEQTGSRGQMSEAVIAEILALRRERAAEAHARMLRCMEGYRQVMAAMSTSFTRTAAALKKMYRAMKVSGAFEEVEDGGD